MVSTRARAGGYVKDNNPLFEKLALQLMKGFHLYAQHIRSDLTMFLPVQKAICAVDIHNTRLCAKLYQRKLFKSSGSTANIFFHIRIFKLTL